MPLGDRGRTFTNAAATNLRSRGQDARAECSHPDCFQINNLLSLPVRDFLFRSRGFSAFQIPELFFDFASIIGVFRRTLHFGVIGRAADIFAPQYYTPQCMLSYSLIWRIKKMFPRNAARH